MRPEDELRGQSLVDRQLEGDARKLQTPFYDGDAGSAGTGGDCPLIVRNPPAAGQAIGTILRLDLLPVNAAKANVTGVDFETSYRTSIGPGEAASRLLGTYNI